MTTTTDLEKELDFTIKRQYDEAHHNKEESIINKKNKFEKFKKIAITTIGVVSITAAGFGANTWIENNQKERIQQAETIVNSSSKEKLFDFINLEKTEAENYFDKNNLLIENYNQHNNIMNILSIQNSPNTKKNSNQNIFDSIKNNLTQDKISISSVFAASNPNENFEQKKEVLLGESFSKFNQWNTGMTTKQFVYVGSLLNLNKEISSELNMLKNSEQEMITTVENKIKNKDYNLELTEQLLVNSVAKDLTYKISDLRGIQSEIYNSPQAYLFTNFDMLSAENAVKDLTNAAANKINQDKNKVKNLINKMDGNESSKLDFSEYYTIYTWVSGGSINKAAALATKNFNTNVEKSSSGKYNIDNKNSYLNLSLNSNNTGYNVNNLRYTINSVNDKAYQARNVYREEQERIRQEQIRAEQARQKELQQIEEHNRMQIQLEKDRIQLESDKIKSQNKAMEIRNNSSNSNYNSSIQQKQVETTSKYKPMESSNYSYKQTKPEIVKEEVKNKKPEPIEEKKKSKYVL